MNRICSIRVKKIGKIRFKARYVYGPVNTKQEEMKTGFSPVGPSVHTNPSQKQSFEQSQRANCSIYKCHINLLDWVRSVLELFSLPFLAV